MLIPRNDPLCGKCLVDKNCDCLCHVEDITEGSHYEIHDDKLTYSVKQVVDLDDFRN